MQEQAEGAKPAWQSKEVPPADSIPQQSQPTAYVLSAN